MCFVLIALQTHPRYPLVLLANRDEFYQRPTRPMHLWEHPPGLFAGRDLKSGGTWLGVQKSGKLALLTNFREPEAVSGERSRGLLVLDFFTSSQSEYQGYLSRHDRSYSGFNLIYGKPGALRYHSNRHASSRILSPGVHGLSNGLLNDPWPKVVRGREMLTEALDCADPKLEAFFSILEDERPAPDSELPNTGVPLSSERMLSPIFIQSDQYGTRCSTIVTVDSDGGFSVTEKTHRTGAVRSFRFQI